MPSGRSLPGSLLARCALAAVAATGCGGKIAPLGDAGADAGDAATDAGDAGDGGDAGHVPVIDSVTPSSGPNSGGTQVTITGSGFTVDGTTVIAFANSPATGVSCSSDQKCVAVSPYAGSFSYDQTVDVQATIGSASNPSEQWSVLRPQDHFTYTGGPPCTGTLTCLLSIYYPSLVLDCQADASFYMNPRQPNPQLLGTGTTFAVSMQNIGAGEVAACYGDPTTTACTSFSTFTTLTGYCGGPAFCEACKEIGGACVTQPNGDQTCTKPFPMGGG